MYAFYHLSHACNMPRPSLSPWSDRPKNISLRADVTQTNLNCLTTVNIYWISVYLRLTALTEVSITHLFWLKILTKNHFLPSTKTILPLRAPQSEWERWEIDKKKSLPCLCRELKPETVQPLAQHRVIICYGLNVWQTLTFIFRI